MSNVLVDTARKERLARLRGSLETRQERNPRRSSPKRARTPAKQKAKPATGPRPSGKDRPKPSNAPAWMSDDELLVSMIDRLISGLTAQPKLSVEEMILRDMLLDRTIPHSAWCPS